MELGDEFLHLPLAHVAGRGEQVAVVGGREVRREQPHRCESHGAILEHLEDHRELPRGASGFDAIVGGVLGEMENLRTVGEEGGEALGKVEASLIEDGEVGDKDCGRRALLLGEELYPGDEILIGEVLSTREGIFVHRSLRMAGPATVEYAPRELMGPVYVTAIGRWSSMTLAGQCNSFRDEFLQTPPDQTGRSVAGEANARIPRRSR